MRETRQGSMKKASTREKRHVRSKVCEEQRQNMSGREEAKRERTERAGDRESWGGGGRKKETESETSLKEE